MKDGPVIANVAALIGDPARANILTALMAGKALTVSELAQEAGVTLQTTSAHLSKLLGGGMGQVDRVTACRLAIERASSRLRTQASSPPIAASDAFFPFPDGPQLLIEAGVRCIVHPGGSKRDNETIDMCEKQGVTCLLTGTRHFRH